jgi:uncharacterized membrane-anchored protein YhcB (DUF1043 family)
MCIILSITGLFKMLLIIIGVFVVLRFIGQLMIAKRNLVVENQLKKERANLEKQRKFIEKNKGKITINNQSNINYQDIDFKEVE